MKKYSLKHRLDALGLAWTTILLIAVMSSLIYTGPALWQTWTHSGPTLVTKGNEAGGAFVAGHDFVAFYSASQAAIGGEATHIYNESYMKQVQHTLVGNSTYGYLAFMYPPPYILLVSPLSLLPYFPALALWLLIPLVALLLAMEQGIRMPTTWLALVLTAPAVGQAAFAGQNGLLFAALLAGGLLWHERKPIPAGILLGIAIAKPQIAVLVFPALVFGRHWKALVAATVTTAVMIGLSTALFGTEIWNAYASVPNQAREWLAAGRLPWARMPTVYASVRLAGTSDTAAIIAQGVIALTVLGAIAWAWRRNVSSSLRIAILLAGMPLTTPFLYDYDLPLMLPALALFIAHASRTGWRWWEKPMLLAVWLQPIWWWTLTATAWEFSIAPIVYSLFFLTVIRRIYLADTDILPIHDRNIDQRT